jgi:hypothetical protein
VLGSSSEVGSSKQGLLVSLNRSELKVDVHLSELVVKALAVSIVEIGLSDLTIVTGGSSAGSTNLARCTSRGAA